MRDAPEDDDHLRLASSSASSASSQRRQVSSSARVGLVGGRRAAGGGRHPGVAQHEAVVPVDRRRLIREAGAMQRRVEPVAALVAGEDAARPVAAVRRRREPDDQDARRGIAESGNRATPVRPVAEASDALRGDAACDARPAADSSRQRISRSVRRARPSLAAEDAGRDEERMRVAHRARHHLALARRLDAHARDGRARPGARHVRRRVALGIAEGGLEAVAGCEALRRNRLPCRRDRRDGLRRPAPRDPCSSTMRTSGTGPRVDDLDQLAEAELSRRRAASGPRSPCWASRTSATGPSAVSTWQLGASPRSGPRRSASTSRPQPSDGQRQLPAVAPRTRRATLGRVAPAAAHHAHRLVDGDAGRARSSAASAAPSASSSALAAPQPRHGAHATPRRHQRAARPAPQDRRVHAQRARHLARPQAVQPPTASR